jgi:hypothetical protein
VYQSILTLLFILSNVCHAQDYCKYNKTKFKITIDDITIFGIVHRTDIDASDVVLPKSNSEILNIGFGTSIKIRIKRKDYVKFEMSYIQKGSAYSLPNQYLEKLRLNYFEIPILWSHCFYRSNKPFYFETGLAFSTLFLSSRKIATYAEQSQNLNIPEFKKVDIPWIASIKAPINSWGKNNLLIGFRFSYSPFSINNNFKTNGIHYITYGIQIDYIFKR